ncbi:hypothetical protein FQB35_08375 [Crassaminicella thermophila]|uniref:Uncharacterized protein n=1 Tax=Crassaminicella thermophila TaxID=2599308 RepID=A0A5C0SE27_CRATE|nr:hypothetical protein [Crassaminicella thermophila]QEK12390.1 hypothetical protein FQB35_08375 [Crassaminicella thermophila]
MTKIIVLSDYSKHRPKKNFKNKTINDPICFYELNDGIKKLAYKYMDTIIRNIQDNFLHTHYQKITSLNKKKKNLFKDFYIPKYLNVNSPFSICHNIKLIRGHHLKAISENDWYNITDMIIRICTITYYDLCKEEVQPIDLAHQYRWTSIYFE